MILTIHQYIEALINTEGRFRTLGKIYPVKDVHGAPVFAMPGNGLVDFEMMSDGKPITMRCPLRSDAESAVGLRTLGEKDRGLGSRFFAEWQLFENEVTLFDDDGGSIEVDVLMRPAAEGEPFAEFLQQATARGDAGTVAAVARSFDEFLEWVHEAGRTGISAKRLRVLPDGSLSLTAFSATDETARIIELIHVAVSGGRISDTEVGYGREKDFGSELDEGDGIRCVRDGAGWAYVDGGGRRIMETVWLSVAPFREGRAEVEVASGKGLIDRECRIVLEPVYEELSYDDYFGIVAVMKDGRWSLLDRDGILLTRETYDWLGECCEGLVLAQKDGHCGFLDAEGREAVPFVYDDATSFAEGCSYVSAGGGSFYIDGKGERLVECAV